ncbi:hypothetical protein V8G54_035607 [Vigna mungo]|uniref:FAR1-related sequence 11-like HTH-like domain-containing protein n=1 Tax=Vigna mungo TaxID=3915 RepID=A0AAQ3RB78_VIGMU
MRGLVAEKGIVAGHLPFLDKDIRNFIQSQSSVGKENDASYVLKLCKGLKNKDDAFQYDHIKCEIICFNLLVSSNVKSYWKATTITYLYHTYPQNSSNKCSSKHHITIIYHNINQ